MIRKNDMVKVISGREKGKTGKVLAVFPEERRALVEKLNMVKRHQRPTPKMRQGGIVEKEAPIHMSNLMLFCAKCGKEVRTGFRLGADGKKGRVCKRCGEVLGG